MSSEELLKRKEQITADLQKTSDYLERGCHEAARVRSELTKTRETLDDLDKQFKDETGLTDTDVAFLFLAIGLQIARQYLITKFPERQDDQISAKQTWGHGEEHSNRTHRPYDPSLEEIITNPVPFDANIGANGALAGGGSLGHRVTAIGHDPVFGLIFGTANIATSTLTTNRFTSYHIYTNQNKRDCFKNTARTDLVISKTVNKMLHEGIEGKTIVGVSLIKEVIHLRSDLYTQHSLPVPLISAVDPKMASSLASYGFDMANLVTVGKQASYAMLINFLIAMVHRLLYNGDNTSMDKKLYEVRTRKILLYSNLVATSSNVLVVAATRDLKKLDIGGAAVTIHRLITDAKFIQEIKQEFIFGSYHSAIMGNRSYQYLPE